MKNDVKKRSNRFIFFVLFCLICSSLTIVSLFPTPFKSIPFTNATEEAHFINIGVFPTASISFDISNHLSSNFTNPLFIGDSLTAGRGASNYDNSFPIQMIHLLKVQNMQSISIFGRSGYTADYINNVIDIQKNAVNSDLIILELGTNDILDRQSGIDKVTHLVNFQQQYRLLVNNLRITAPQAPLLCLSLWWSSGEIAPSGLSVSQLNQIIENQCNAYKGKYVDLSTIFNDPSDHTGGIDWFHPNNRGHSKIAEKIIQVLHNTE